MEECLVPAHRNQHFQWLGATTEMLKMRKVELRSVNQRAVITKEPALRASSRAGSRSSVTDCASTATKPALPRSPSPPRSSTECSTLDARTPSASPDQQWGTGAPLPLPPPCNTLPPDGKLARNLTE